MTWLPVENAFGLLPEQWENLQEVHEAAWAMNDRDLLELARVRMARTLGADVDGYDEPRTDTERAALDYIDHIVLDCNSVTPEHNIELERCLGSRKALYQFVAAANMVEAILRVCILLDLEPLGPPAVQDMVEADEPEDTGPPPAAGVELRKYYSAVIDKRYFHARAAYGESVVRLDGVDALTTEAVRLRNATFQHCRY
jgi:hypothetical protein